VTWFRQMQLHQFNKGPWNTVEEIVSNLTADGIDCLIFKSHHQTNFIGNNHDLHQLGIRSAEDAIVRTDQLRRAGIEAYPWCVPTGAQMAAEIDIAVGIARETGALGINLEAGWPDFWEKPAEDFITYLEAVRNGAPQAMLSVCFDTVSRRYDRLLVDRWAHLADQLQPECYPVDFEWTTQHTLQQALDQLGGLGVEKLVPCLGLTMGAAELTDQAGPWLVANGVSRVSAWVMHTSTPAVRQAFGQIELIPDLASHGLELPTVGDYEANVWAPIFAAAHFLQDPSGDFEVGAWQRLFAAANYLQETGDRADARAANDLLIVLGGNKLFHGAQGAAPSGRLDDAECARRILECLTQSKVRHGAQ